MKQREELYDQMKGIGMLLLFWGHLFTYGSIPFSLIFAFHMPLFFFVAGIVFKPTTITHCASKCFNRYILPYLFFWLIGFVFMAIKWVFVHGKLEWKEYLSSTLYYLGPNQEYVDSIWFLPILAMSLLMVNLIVQSKVHQSNTWRCVIIVILSLASILMEYVQIHFMRITTLCTTTLFVYLGYLCKDEFKQIIRMKYSNIIAIVLFPIFIALSIINRTINISIPIYNNYVLFIVCALIGIYITAIIADKSIGRLFEFMEKNSLPIFCTHGYSILLYTSILGEILEEPMRRMVNIPNLWSFIGGGVIFTLALPMCCIFKPLLDRFVKMLSIKEDY